MSFFYIDEIRNQIITWDQLFKDLNEIKSFEKIVKTNDYYHILRSIIISLFEEIEIVLLDPGEEILHSQLSKNSKLKKINYPSSKKDFRKRIRTINNWKVTLYSSGTTGLPKAVNHNLKSINRFLKVNSAASKNIWGLAYNPSHIAGLQVIMQAIYNGNTIVRLFGLSKQKILEQIEYYSITNISATPTFYKLLFPIKNKYDSVKRITSGGESFNKILKENIKLVFPNAKITNVYASTEAGSLLASDGEYFEIKKDLKKFVRINNSEIEVQSSLLGKIGQNIKDKSKWFKTGDLVEMHKSNPQLFKITSRKSDLINIAGLNVNPIEVEELILGIKGILNARVRAKKNSLVGNILICDVVVNKVYVDEQYIKKYLKKTLPKYKIPQIFKFKENISLTRTGKTNRL
jgi:acyl-CoA synthetase (AMP-forming)/AMP-acid ligase II